MYKVAALTLLSFSLSGCEQPPAVVVDHGRNIYSMNNIKGLKSLEVNNTVTTEPAAAMKKAQTVAISSTELPPLSSAPSLTGKEIRNNTLETASKSKFIRPVDGPQVTEFGDTREGVLADGINIEARAGSPVKAAADGEVVFVGSQIKSYGNMVIIRHAGRLNTTYAHLGNVSVNKGQRVVQGDVIGNVGTTGAVTTPQLHFAVREGATPVSPKQFL